MGWLAKCASAMSNNFAISSTGFKGGPPSGAQAVFIHSIRCLIAAIEPALLKVSCKVKRGPPPLGSLPREQPSHIAITHTKKTLSQHSYFKAPLATSKSRQTTSEDAWALFISRCRYADKEYSNQFNIQNYNNV